MGTAKTQGALWGAMAQDWADVQEETVAPLYQAVLSDTEAGPGTTLLDIGCGAGLACLMAARRGAKVSGIDAAEPLVSIARARLPRGDFHVGEMEELPFSDEQFSVVTGFNAFQYAADPVGALKEARRVVRRGGCVVMAVWGKPEDTQAAAYLAALGSLLPPPPPGAAGPFALSQDGALEVLASEAGLTPTSLKEVDTLWLYPDIATALRGLLSAGPAVRAVQQTDLRTVQDAVTRAIEPFGTPSGRYALHNKFRYLVARA